MMEDKTPRDLLCELTVKFRGDEKAIREAMKEAIIESPDLMLSMLEEISERNPDVAEKIAEDILNSQG